MRKPIVYLASPLFSEAERQFNRLLRDALQECWEVFLPQESGYLLADLVAEGIPDPIAARRVFDADVAAIEASDLVVVVLDGRAVDEGAAFELGYAWARGIACVGLQTDPRRLLPFGNNPMLSVPLRTVFDSTSELCAWMASDGVSAARDRGAMSNDV